MAENLIKYHWIICVDKIILKSKNRNKIENYWTINKLKQQDGFTLEYGTLTDIKKLIKGRLKRNWYKGLKYKDIWK
jgi:hypothetical protein